MKLNIGAGEVINDEYVAIDRKLGLEAYPLDDTIVKIGDVEEIRASHILEHFPAAEVRDVIHHWVNALRPGGVLKISVPDFSKIAHAYTQNAVLPYQGFVMGGQVNDNDYHRSIFDRKSLEMHMRGAGLISISDWTDEIDDCAKLPISLNLRGVKPTVSHEDVLATKVSAVMSTGRLGFMDNFFGVHEALMGWDIPIRRVRGAFWGQCLERGIDEALDKDNPDFILTIDYDTFFTPENVRDLITLGVMSKGVDAIAAFQLSRQEPTPLFTIEDPVTKQNTRMLPLSALEGDLIQVKTAHFGLTLLRASMLRELDRPLFIASPNEDGKWEDGRVDDDISFWLKLWKLAIPAYVAPHVVVGHGEYMVKLPGKDLAPIYQHPKDYCSSGMAEEAFR